MLLNSKNTFEINNDIPSAAALLWFPISILIDGGVLSVNRDDVKNDYLREELSFLWIQTWADLLGLVNIKKKNKEKELSEKLNITLAAKQKGKQWSLEKWEKNLVVDDEYVSKVHSLWEEFYALHERSRHSDLCIKPIHWYKPEDVLEASIDVLYERNHLVQFSGWSQESISELLSNYDLDTGGKILALVDVNKRARENKDNIMQQIPWINVSNAWKINFVWRHLHRVIGLMGRSSDLCYPSIFSSKEVRSFLLDNDGLLEQAVSLHKEWKSFQKIWEELNLIADIYIQNNFSNSLDEVKKWIDFALRSHKAQTQESENNIDAVLSVET